MHDGASSHVSGSVAPLRGRVTAGMTLARWHRISGCIAAAASLVLGLVACSRQAPPADAPLALPVEVLADTGRSERLVVRPPARAEVWLVRVSSSSPPTAAIRPARPLADDLAPPEPTPGQVEAELPPPPALEVDDDLKPPLIRARAPIAVPPGGRRGSVELDVRVDVEGVVTDALWVGGTSDSAQVQAAIRCALGMRFYPALQAGHPVAVWCRQRFDFPGR